MIRDPFPNNIIPRDRIFNPGRQLQEPADGAVREDGAAAEPELRRERTAAERQLLPGRPAGLADRAISTASASITTRPTKDRFFFRTSGVTFLEYVSDWTYQNPDPTLRMHSADRSRYQWSYTGTWTRTHGLDGHRHLVRDQPLQPGRQVPRPEAVQADRRRAAVATSTTSARRTAAARCRIDRHQRLSGYRRRPVGRRHRDAPPGAVVA